MKVLSTQIYPPERGQRRYEEIRTVGFYPKYTLRFTIISGLIPERSSAVCEVWSKQDNRWNPVCDLPHTDIKTPEGLAEWVSEPHPGIFFHDVDVLYQRTLSILGLRK